MTNKSEAVNVSRRAWLASVAVVLALTAGAAASAAQQQAAAGIKNFGKVNENYYRGAQPDAEGFAELKQKGIKTVIDLRKDSRREAPELARAAGLAYVNIPLVASRPATEGETEQFLKLVNDPANWPVYVHCKGGRHRTGALTAVYRITHDGWTADQAFDEMLKYDFEGGRSLFSTGDGRARQKRYVYAFYERHGSAKGDR